VKDESRNKAEQRTTTPNNQRQSSLCSKEYHEKTTFGEKRNPREANNAGDSFKGGDDLKGGKKITPKLPEKALKNQEQEQ